MFSRFSYTPVSSSAEDPEAGLKTQISFSKWHVPRKVRTALLVVLFLALLCALSFRYSDIQDRIQEFRSSNATALPTTPPTSTTTPKAHDVASNWDSSPRWSDFAYVQYVTNAKYLCNSLMIFEALRRFNTKADLLMMYPQHWQVPAQISDTTSAESKLLVKARDEYKANLVPIKVKTFVNEADPTWQDSYTKLLAFNQTQYKRLVSLDSDATVLDHMDELFLLPPAPVAMPRAYWMDKFFLSSQLVVLTPSQHEWARVETAMENHVDRDYDMDILNKLYGTSCMVISHRTYDLLTAEFKTGNHKNFLGSETEKWEPRAAMKEAKYLHFSDWPMPKPWLEPSDDLIAEHAPKCEKREGSEEDCVNRDLWLEIRKDFADRHEQICGVRYSG